MRTLRRVKKAGLDASKSTHLKGRRPGNAEWAVSPWKYELQERTVGSIRNFRSPSRDTTLSNHLPTTLLYGVAANLAAHEFIQALENDAGEHSEPLQLTTHFLSSVADFGGASAAKQIERKHIDMIMHPLEEPMLPWEKGQGQSGVRGSMFAITPCA